MKNQYDFEVLWFMIMERLIQVISVISVSYIIAVLLLSVFGLSPDNFAPFAYNIKCTEGTKVTLDKEGVRALVVKQGGTYTYFEGWQQHTVSGTCTVSRYVSF